MEMDHLIDEIVRRVQEKLRESEEAVRCEPAKRQECVCGFDPKQETEVEAVLLKRVLTEQDMISACSPGLTVLHVSCRAILTDLAKDYAKVRRIKVVRDQ